MKINPTISMLLAVRLQSGSVSSEYLVAGTLVSIALFAGQPSPIMRLIYAIDQRFQVFSFLVSLP
ncbi:MAG: hypothetical protein WBD34_20620 [Burkholderiaceae bacterium]